MTFLINKLIQSLPIDLTYPSFNSFKVIGESKINVEKDAIVSDGKQRFETYQLVLTKKNSQGN